MDKKKTETETPTARVYCAGCNGKLERSRAKHDIDHCKSCAPGWPRNADGSLYDYDREKS